MPLSVILSDTLYLRLFIRSLFALTGTNADYISVDVAPEELAARFGDTLSKLDGFNVTIPHKSAVIPLLDKICGKAEICGSVNTVKTGAENLGFTTDGAGFLKAVENAGVNIGGRTLILGAGGAASHYMRMRRKGL